ncbi:MAG: O-antigen ligase family protein [Bacteroidetes bacterium]|nr:O-antigen ligase family protein [Bacteroidota bacterium]
MRNAPWLAVFIVFTALYVLGILWSDNHDEALNSIQVKIPVFLLSIVFASIRLTEKETRKVFIAFVIGLIGVGVFMIVRGALRYSELGTSTFVYQTFTENIMHPSYLALYFVSGIVFLFHGVLLKNESSRNKLIATLLGLFFAFIVFLLSSKMGFLSLAAVLIFYTVYAVIRFKRYVSGAIALFVLVGGAWLAIQTSPRLEETFQRMMTSLSGNKVVDPTSSESSEVRMLIWSADAVLIMDAPLYGYGTGDVQDELMNKYEESGMTGAFEKKLNAHSQFFQTGLALGWLGLAVLLTLTLGVVLWAIRARLGIIVIVGGLLTINMIPESILQLQAGTMYVGFLYSILLFSADRKVFLPD